ncbi:hypothetical protein ACFQU7_42285 [Pseudoroseomonas wenyumeiae]
MVDADVDPRLNITAWSAPSVCWRYSGAGRPHPMSLSQRAEVPGLDKNSAQWVSYTLTRLGYIERDDGVRYFIPANKFLDRYFDFLRINPLADRATSAHRIVPHGTGARRPQPAGQPVDHLCHPAAERTGELLRPHRPAHFVG